MVDEATGAADVHGLVNRALSDMLFQRLFPKANLPTLALDDMLQALIHATCFLAMSRRSRMMTIGMMMMIG